MLGGFVRLLKNEDGLRVTGCGPILGVIRDRRGAVAILLAVTLSGIVGFAGLGSEVASWYYTRRAMQGAADSAASSAAAELAAATSAGSSASSGQLTDEARSIAASYNFANGTNSITVTVNNPPATTTNLPTCSSPFSSFNCYVEVIISQPQTALLSALFMSTGPTIATRAVALANTTVSDAGCVVALSKHSDSIDINASGSVAMTFNGCALYDNSPASNALTLNGGATISAKAAYVSGGISGSGLTTADGAFTGVNPITDPYAGIPSPSGYSTEGSCGRNNKLHITSGSSQTITPSSGCSDVYDFGNDVQIDGGGTLNLCSGTYVFDAASLIMQGNATLNAPPSSGCTTSGGVTLIFTNKSGGSPGIVNIASNATVNLTAPTSGSYAGVAVFQDRLACSGTGNNNNGCTSQFNGGANQNITGAIYFPNNSVQYAGGSSTGGSQCTQLIAYTITFTGGSTFNSGCSSAGTKTISSTNGTLVM